MSLNIHKNLKAPVRIVLVAVFCALFCVLLVAAAKHQERKPIQGFSLHIVNQNRMSVLEKRNLEKWIMANPQVSLKEQLKTGVNLKRIEQQAALNPWVANAEVYIDNNDRLHIDITERKPVARVFQLDGHSFYMDSAMARMPVIQGNNFSVPVFTNAFSVKNDSMKNALFAKITYMAELIGKDSFWNAQIEQVVVGSDQTFVLVPLLGKKQQIMFGDTSRAVEKLGNLFAFYKHITPKIGWENYRTLDVRYQGQVIARPSLGITLAKPKDPLKQQEIKTNH